MAKPKSPKKQNDEAAVTPLQDTPTSTAGPNQVRETSAAQPGKSFRRPSIVKTEPRSNVLPINMEDEIRRLAYLISERRGFEPGHEAEDWLNAEREVRQRYHQQSA